MPTYRMHKQPEEGQRVLFSDLARPWKAEIKVNYKPRYLGYYSTYEEADQAERAMRLQLTGREEPMIGGPLRHA